MSCGGVGMACVLSGVWCRILPWLAIMLGAEVVTPIVSKWIFVHSTLSWMTQIAAKQLVHNVEELLRLSLIQRVPVCACIISICFFLRS